MSRKTRIRKLHVFAYANAAIEVCLPIFADERHLGRTPEERFFGLHPGAVRRVGDLLLLAEKRLDPAVVEASFSLGGLAAVKALFRPLLEELDGLPKRARQRRTRRARREHGIKP